MTFQHYIENKQRISSISFFLKECYLRVLFTDFIYLTQNIPDTSVIKYSPTSEVTELHILSLTSFQVLIFQTCSTVKMLPHPKTDYEHIFGLTKL